MNGRWINLGRDEALVDESGTVVGFVRPMDEQISFRVRLSFYEASRPLKIDGHRFIGKPPDRKGA